MTTRRQSSDDYIAVALAEADGAFARHQIFSRDGRSWVCKNPKESALFWFEVIVLAAGELYVHGDIGGVHFAHYGKHTSPGEVVRWIGTNRSLGYVSEKARIGMGRGADACLEHFSETVWLDHALDAAEQHLGRPLSLDEWSTSTAVEALGLPQWLEDRLVQVVENVESIAEMNATADFDADGYEAGMLEWGTVPTHRLLYAYAAVKKLAQLLDAEKEVA